MTLVARTPYRQLWHRNSYPQGWLVRTAWPVRETGRDTWNPRFDVTNNKQQLIFRVRLTDVKPEDIDITVSDGVITFKGSRSREHCVEREDCKWTGESRVNFIRSIALPETVEGHKAEASFEEGVLEVVIPRAKPEKPRHISIRAAATVPKPVGDHAAGKSEEQYEAPRVTKTEAPPQEG